MSLAMQGPCFPKQLASCVSAMTSGTSLSSSKEVSLRRNPKLNLLVYLELLNFNEKKWPGTLSSQKSSETPFSLTEYSACSIDFEHINPWQDSAMTTMTMMISLHPFEIFWRPKHPKSPKTFKNAPEHAQLLAWIRHSAAERLCAAQTHFCCITFLDFLGLVFEGFFIVKLRLLNEKT